MADRETSHDIDAAAADWVARVDRGPLREDEEQAFQAWMKGDARRRGAFMRADALSMMSESARALGTGFDTRDFAETHKEETAAAPRQLASPHSRRTAMLWAGRGAVATAALVALGSAFSSSAGAITTRRGEIRRVPLEDGSSMELNTETSVRVLYGAEQRRIQVLYGEVFFTVTRNDRRPFIVELGNGHIATSLGSFRVRRLPDRPADVLVDQGHIQFAPAKQAFAPIGLSAGTLLTVPERSSDAPAPTPQTVAPRAITQQLAWREGKIAFEGDRLDQAAAQFARYSDIRIVIEDPALAAEPITGLFAANDPVGFSRAVATIVDAQVERSGGNLILRRPSRS